uniref:UAS domain-containing protein n=1 Tax=Scylla olivacea TaxID=85551 RepID=A0A0P4WYV4_SCYOL
MPIDPRIQAALGIMGKGDKEVAAAAAQLSQQFHLLCGRGGPRLSCYTLGHAISRARYTTQRDSEQERLVGLYLHHQDSPYANTFCSEVLGNERVAAFFNDNYVLWGWDLKEHIASRSILQEIKKFLYPSQVKEIVNLEPEQLPVLITIVPTPLDWEILSVIQGSSSSVDDVMTALQTTRTLHAAQTIITRQVKEEEEDVEDLIHTRILVMLRGVQTNKAWDEHSWSFPLSFQYELSLLAVANDIIKQEEEERARMDAWKKAITAAIKEGGDIATIQEMVTAENADPMTQVMVLDFPLQNCCLMSLAAWEGRADVVTLLHAVGVSVEGADTTVLNPLLAAATRGHAEVVVVLVTLGADCLARDDRGNTALHLAAYHGHQQCVTLLAAATPVHESVTDHNGCTPVHAAAVKGHWVVVQQLSAAGWSLHTLDNQGNTLLHSAAMGGSVRLVEGLVAAGLNPNLRNSSGHTPLAITVQQGNHTLEAWFLKRQPARRSQHLATPAAMLCLMRAQMDQDRTTYNEYMSAIKVMSRQEYLRSLLEASDPHLVDDEGRTALHVLAQFGYFNLSPAMLHWLGHHHVRTRAGLTPLDLARRLPSRKHSQRMVLESHQCPRVSGDRLQDFTLV